MGKKGINKKRYLSIAVAAVSALVIFSQYQNCAMTATGQGLNFGATSSSSTGVSCPNSGCGAIENVYWNHCQLTVEGWAWSKDTSLGQSVSLSNGNGDACNTTTVTATSPAIRDLATVYGQQPYMAGQPISYSCTFGPRANYSSNSITISATTGSNFEYSAGTKTVYPPADCSTAQTSAPINTCSTGGTGVAMGWISSSQWGSAAAVPSVSLALSNALTVTQNNSPGNCNLTIQGWAWIVGVGNASVVGIYLPDGSYVETNPSIADTSVQSYAGANFSCVGANPDFQAVFSNHPISSSYVVTGYNGDKLISVTGVVYSTSMGVYQQLDPMYVSVPTACIK